VWPQNVDTKQAGTSFYVSLGQILRFTDRVYAFANEHSGVIRLPLANGWSEAERGMSASRVIMISPSCASQPTASRVGLDSLSRSVET
jgi:hypothetical protein